MSILTKSTLMWQVTQVIQLSRQFFFLSSYNLKKEGEEGLARESIFVSHTL
jgi:hypothetical protein